MDCKSISSSSIKGLGSRDVVPIPGPEEGCTSTSFRTVIGKVGTSKWDLRRRAW